MRKHAVVFVDVERHESTDGGDAVERVEEEPLMLQGAPPRFDEFEKFSSVKASTRRSTPVETSASTWAFTFSTPASANTTGVVSEDVAPRLAASNTATLLTGANVSATRQAKIRRDRSPHHRGRAAARQEHDRS